MPKEMLLYKKLLQIRIMAKFICLKSIHPRSGNMMNDVESFYRANDVVAKY